MVIERLIIISGGIQKMYQLFRVDQIRNRIGLYKNKLSIIKMLKWVNICYLNRKKINAKNPLPYNLISTMPTLSLITLIEMYVLLFKENTFTSPHPWTTKSMNMARWGFNTLIVLLDRLLWWQRVFKIHSSHSLLPYIMVMAR